MKCEYNYRNIRSADQKYEMRMIIKPKYVD